MRLQANTIGTLLLLTVLLSGALYYSGVLGMPDEGWMHDAAADEPVYASEPCDDITAAVSAFWDNAAQANLTREELITLAHEREQEACAANPAFAAGVQLLAVSAGVAYDDLLAVMLIGDDMRV